MNTLIKKGVLLGSTFLVSLMMFAQDKDANIDININKDDSNWYQQPWVWIVAAAVFVLLLAAILRGGSRKEA